MNATKVILVFSTVGLLGFACAQMKQNLPQGGVGDTLASGAGKAAEIAEKSKKCDALKEMKVAVEEEVAIGGAVAVNWVAKGGGVVVDVPTSGNLKDAKGLNVAKTPKNDLNRYLNRIGKNLAAQSSRPSLDWTFGVLESEGFNAFSAPGGYALVTRGLLKQVDIEAQQADVLAQEISHMTERHAMTLYSNVKANQCRAAIAGDIGGELAAPLTASFEGLISGSSGGFLDLNDV